MQLARDAAFFQLARLVRGGTELLELLLRLAQLLYRTNPGADVAQDDRVEPLVAVGEVGDRSVDGKFVAIATKAGDDARFSHSSGRSFAGAESPHMAGVHPAKAIGKEAFERHTERLFPGVSEHGLDYRVKKH